jgi:hypothetical protein
MGALSTKDKLKKTVCFDNKAPILIMIGRSLLVSFENFPRLFSQLVVLLVMWTTWACTIKLFTVVIYPS